MHKKPLDDRTFNDGAFSKQMHRFGEHDIGSHIDEQLGLDEGTMQEKSATEQGSEITTSNKLSTKFRICLAP
jgi:hypothetical protein